MAPWRMGLRPRKLTGSGRGDADLELRASGLNSPPNRRAISKRPKTAEDGHDDDHHQREERHALKKTRTHTHPITRMTAIAPTLENFHTKKKMARADWVKLPLWQIGMAPRDHKGERPQRGRFSADLRVSCAKAWSSRSKISGVFGSNTARYSRNNPGRR